MSECCRGGLSRRRFLGLTAAGAGTAFLASRTEAAYALGTHDLVGVPADKSLDPAWLRSLTARGEPTVFSGEQAKYLGMPVGGGCSGQLYLGADGRLWHWDVYNARATSTSDLAYSEPPPRESPFRQGFVMRTTNAANTTTRTLDSDGFTDVSLVGQYPIGRVTLRDDESPVHVTLEAFSPFVPLDVDDSTLPVTVLAYTVENVSAAPVRVDLLGWSENPVCLDTRDGRYVTLTAEQFDGTAPGVEFSAVDRDAVDPRPDVVVETWERSTYEGWQATGDAFGSGPALVSSLPDYMKRDGDLNAEGERMVTSHRFEDGDAVQADDHVGTLTSPPFTVERRYLQALVGGGGHERTCLEVRVGGDVVATFTGAGTEVMSWQSVDLGRWDGEQATIRLVDDVRGGWGHVNVDTIRQSDRPLDSAPVAGRPDHGTFAIAACEPDTVVRPSVTGWKEPEDLFDAADGPSSVDGGLQTLTGTVRTTVRLRPGESKTVRFLVAWHFPVPDRKSLEFLRGSDQLRRHYATRFDSARAVASHVATRRGELERKTRLWVDTWYESSSLPHWLLERVMATASTFATSTCYRFHDGRFYGWEGVYCCAGTCEHVWNYAQSIARLFPTLERDTRERVDLGIGYHADTGQMGFRAEADMTWAADGQCGTILRIYREHQMAPDSTFLTRNWPQVKDAVTYLIRQDAGTDGTFEGAQPNTLDTVWYGEIAWITGMYVAALHAGAAMAEDVGDSAFAATCRGVASSGAAFLDSTLWTGEYYIQRVDPEHDDAINSNKGCHIDQMFGETLARQLGLPRVFDEKKAKTALESLYKYNFTPDPAQYRKDHPEISGGRWFAMADEPALLMTTWPHGGADDAAGDPPSWAAMYFNEAWTGQEYQAATQMVYDGEVEKGLVVTRAVHDRYVSGKRNPFNEIECGEHYARAMAAHGVYLGLSGFEYHGPKGHIAFAPRITPDDFSAAFTAAEGWGLYRQRRAGGSQTSALEVRYGKVALRTLGLAADRRPESVHVRVGSRKLAADWSYDSGTVTVTLPRRTPVTAGQTLTVTW